jgi:hypothetical protein
MLFNWGGESIPPPHYLTAQEQRAEIYGLPKVSKLEYCNSMHAAGGWGCMKEWKALVCGS